MVARFNVAYQDLPLGNEGYLVINTFDRGAFDDMATVQVQLFNSVSTLISDETWSGVDIDTAATDGGSIEIVDITGTGRYEWRYTPPNDGTYTPGASGLNFTVTVTITDQAAEGSGMDTKSIGIKLIASSVSVSFESSSVVQTIKRQGGLLEDLVIVSNGGEKSTSIDGGTTYIMALEQSAVYAVETAEKNGDALTLDTDYYWFAPRPYLTVTPQPVLSDTYYFQLQHSLSDAGIDAYIISATRIVLSQLAGFYEDNQLSTYPTVLNFVKDMALGQIRMDLSEGIALESAQYRSGHDLVQDVMSYIRKVKRGESTILDSDGQVVPKVRTALVGGLTHPDGRVLNSQDIRERLASFQGIALNFYPFDPQNVTSSA